MSKPASTPPPQQPLAPSAVNPARLRKTAAVTGHAAALQDPTASKKTMPKGRRHQEKLFNELKDKKIRSLNNTGIDLGSFILYALISIVFYSAVIGWFFNVPILSYIFISPFKGFYSAVTFPIRLIVRYIMMGSSYVTGFTSVVFSQESNVIPKVFDPEAAKTLLTAVVKTVTNGAQATYAAEDDDDEYF
ncbi:hypothetical protein HDU76_013408 [Blyttiomyces sp. JEL0837]|nr:hypothetical protein HDU76_013408 [Blyttiomyces sp. JEL0837]